jgi:hypothetical protein
MSRNMKIVVGVVAVVVLVGCVGMLSVGFLFTRMLSSAMDPSQAGQVASEITDYTLPDGYGPVMGTNLMGVKLVMFGPEGMASRTRTGGSMPTDGELIMMMQMPAAAAVDADQMRDQMLQNMGGQAGVGNNMTSAGTLDATIRGKPVTLQVSEGTARSGEAIKAVSGVFDGNGGPAMLMIIGSTDAWDQRRVEAFLASLK